MFDGCAATRDELLAELLHNLRTQLALSTRARAFCGEPSLAGSSESYHVTAHVGQTEGASTRIAECSMTSHLQEL